MNITNNRMKNYATEMRLGYDSGQHEAVGCDSDF